MATGARRHEMNTAVRNPPHSEKEPAIVLDEWLDSEKATIRILKGITPVIQYRMLCTNIIPAINAGIVIPVGINIIAKGLFVRFKESTSVIRYWESGKYRDQFVKPGQELFIESQYDKSETEWQQMIKQLFPCSTICQSTLLRLQ
jgi:hypothetical protein